MFSLHDIFNVIGHLHMNSSYFGGKPDKFGRKSENKLGAAVPVELGFTTSGRLCYPHLSVPCNHQTSQQFLVPNQAAMQIASKYLVKHI